MISKFAKFALATTVLFVTTIATAADIECSRDDNADDWSITGQLGGAEIELFDNDSWSTFRLRGVAESLPPVYVYQEKSSPSTIIEVKPSRNGDEATALYYEKSEGRAKGITFSCGVN